MKHQLAVLLILACTGCASLLNEHPLEPMAEKVPVKLFCPVTDGTKAREAIAAYKVDPEALRSKLVEQAKTDTVSVACLLLDAHQLLEDTGQQLSAAYKATTEALEALEIL